MNGESSGTELQVPSQCAGQRLDQVLAGLLPAYSRSFLQRHIREGRVRVNGSICPAKTRLLGGETLEVESLEPDTPRQEDPAQKLPLDILHQDDDLLVLNKPAGLVMHPAAGNPDGTLVNALLHHDPALRSLPRAGIVHRLDKDTSGLLVVACNPRAHAHLVAQLQARRVTREYLALVTAQVVAGGRVEAPIGRHPVDRKRMAVVDGGKPAVSHYRVEERFRVHTLLRVSLETGRTHQIRVHMAHRRYPLLGDPVYGGRPRLPPDPTPALVQVVLQFPRQALHATRLSLKHPDGTELSWDAPPPGDMQQLLTVLREDTQQHPDRHHE